MYNNYKSDSFIIRNMQNALDLTADFNADDSDASSNKDYNNNTNKGATTPERMSSMDKKGGKDGKGHVTFQGDANGANGNSNRSEDKVHPDDLLLTGSSMNGDHLAKLSSLATAANQANRGGGRNTFTVNMNRKKVTNKAFRRASDDAVLEENSKRNGSGGTNNTNNTHTTNKEQEPFGSKSNTIANRLKVKKKRKNTRRQLDFHDLDLKSSRISWGSDDEVYNRRGSIGTKSGSGGKDVCDDLNRSDTDLVCTKSIDDDNRSNESNDEHNPRRRTNPHTGDSDSETAASEGYECNHPKGGREDDRSHYESNFTRFLRKTSITHVGTSLQNFSKRLSNGSQPSHAGGMAYGGGGVTGPYGGGGPDGNSGHAHRDSYDLSVPTLFDHSVDRNGRPIRSSRRRSNESDDLSSYADDDHREVWDDHGWDDIRHRGRGVLSKLPMISNLLPWGGRTNYPRYQPHPTVHRGFRRCMAIIFIVVVVTLSSYFLSSRVTQSEGGLRGKDKMETMLAETAENENVGDVESDGGSGTELEEEIPSLSEALDLPSSTNINSTSQLLTIADDIVESCNTASLSTTSGRIACQKLCHDHTCCFDYSGDGYYCGDDESKMCILYAGCEVLVVGGWVEGELGGIDDGEEWDDEEEDYWSADEQDEADAATGKGGGDGASGSGGSAGAAGTFNSAQIARSIVNKCNEPSLATPSGLQECHSLCQDHLCCFEDTAEENCLDGRRDLRHGQKVEDDTKERAMECLLYAGCAGLLDHPEYLQYDTTSGGTNTITASGSAANSAAYTAGQSEDVLHYCSESNLQSTSGRSECEAICSSHMCCFEESNRGVGVSGGSCKSQKKREQCPEYAGCVVLSLDEDGDGILDSTQADTTDEAGESGTNEGEEPGEAEEVPVFHGWGGAAGISSDPNADPSNNPLNPSFLPAQEVLDHCTLELIETQNGRLQCESVCAHHMCCFDEDLDNNCQGDYGKQCIAYSGCVILVYDLMEEGMSILDMELDLDEDDYENVDDVDGAKGGEDDWVFDNEKEPGGEESGDGEEYEAQGSSEEAPDALAALEGFNHPSESGTTSDTNDSGGAEITVSTSGYSMADIPPPPPRCSAYPSSASDNDERSNVFTDDWTDDKYDRCKRWERKYKIRIVDYYAKYGKDLETDGEGGSDESSAAGEGSGGGAEGAEFVPDDDINQTDDDKFTYSSYESGQKTQEESLESPSTSQDLQTVTDPLAALAGMESSSSTSPQEPQDVENEDEDEDTTWEDEVDEVDDEMFIIGEVEEDNAGEGINAVDDAVDGLEEVDDAVEDTTWEDEDEVDDDMLIIGEVEGDTRSGNTVDDAINAIDIVDAPQALDAMDALNVPRGVEAGNTRNNENGEDALGALDALRAFNIPTNVEEIDEIDDATEDTAWDQYGDEEDDDMLIIGEVEE